jgi:hypothetical protein
MSRLTAADLKAAREMVTEEVDVAGLGTILVRGLTRAEVLGGQQGRSGAAEIERYMLATGCVDPELTEADVAEIQAVSLAGELEAATRRIQELSKIDVAAAQKEYYKSVSS